MHGTAMEPALSVRTATREPQPLVVDVGMHTGEDTAFYLRKGFRVLAIEANPALCERARLRFAEAIGAGRLDILNVAVANQRGQIDLYVNDQKEDWTTISTAMRDRNAARGKPSRLVQVEARCFEDILQGLEPYYVKIDIEGADICCLDGLVRSDIRPRYVSIEASIEAFGEAAGELGMLYRLGYRRFKIVNQGNNHRIRCPSPPLEGVYVDQAFDGHMSGPFGEEAPGEWLNFEDALATYRRILARRAKHGESGSQRGTPWNNLYLRYLHRIGQPMAWWDFHAARE